MFRYFIIVITGLFVSYFFIYTTILKYVDESPQSLYFALILSGLLVYKLGRVFYKLDKRNIELIDNAKKYQAKFIKNSKSALSINELSVAKNLKITHSHVFKRLFIMITVIGFCMIIFAFGKYFLDEAWYNPVATTYEKSINQNQISNKKKTP